MDHVANRHTFEEVAPAAASVFSYVRSAQALRAIPLDFVYAMVDKGSARAVVKFSGAAPGAQSGPVVWVTALTRLDGTWDITHSFGW